MAQKEAQHREQVDELNEELARVRSDLGEELAKVRRQNDEISVLSRDQVRHEQYAHRCMTKF